MFKFTINPLTGDEKHEFEVFNSPETEHVWRYLVDDTALCEELATVTASAIEENPSDAALLIRNHIYRTVWPQDEELQKMREISRTLLDDACDRVHVREIASELIEQYESQKGMTQ